MNQIIREQEYRVSERVVIRKGDAFRATGGPYWKSSGGVRISLRSKGPYRFIAYARLGAIGWIECYDKSGCLAILHVEGRRRKIDGSIVTRPYRVTGKKRQLQRLDNRKRAR